MLERFEISALISAEEMNMLLNHYTPWNFVNSHCKTYQLKNTAIRELTLMNVSKDNLHHYCLLIINFNGMNIFVNSPKPTDKDPESYVETIRDCIFDILPFYRPTMLFRIHQLRFLCNVNGKYFEEYFLLLKKGFQLKNLEMKLSHTPSGFIFENNDTRIKILRYNNATSVPLSFNYTGSFSGANIQITISKDKILWLVKRMGFKDREIYALFNYPYFLALEFYVIHYYMEQITKTGSFYSFDVLKAKIHADKSISPKKKERLLAFVTILNDYENMEDFMTAVNTGKHSSLVKNQKAALDYIRFLNEKGMNHLTLPDSLSLDCLNNPLRQLSNIYKFNPNDIRLNRTKYMKEYIEKHFVTIQSQAN